MEGALAPRLLCAALGLMLSFGASRRVIASGLAAMLAAAILGTLVPVGPGYEVTALAACWIGVLVAAACMHLPRGLGQTATILLCLLTGLWTGLTAAALRQPAQVLLAVPWILLCLPGAWLVAGNRGIVVKIAGSWLAAAAILSLGLNMVPTLGYEPDHRE